MPDVSRFLLFLRVSVVSSFIDQPGACPRACVATGSPRCSAQQTARVEGTGAG